MATDSDFRLDASAVARAASLLELTGPAAAPDLPDVLPPSGIGEAATIETLAPWVIGGAARLGATGASAHMDPPTPRIAWIATFWNAALNQNVLHPATAPVARVAEERVMAWIAPAFGMRGGWMCSGATLANLNALWAARDAGGVRRVVASADAHVSIEKSARLLGLAFERVPVDRERRIDARQLPPLDDACLVLTAGTTNVGAIDDLTLSADARWRHVDAAWAGPLRFSAAHRGKLDGIELADSVAVSAHKLMFQPKSAALVLFRDPARVGPALALGGTYLAAPNLGVEGSRGATAVTLLATLLAWGRAGLAERVDRCMNVAAELEARIAADPGLLLRGASDSGVVVFRGATGRKTPRSAQDSFSTVMLDGERWGRSACANPMAEPSLILEVIHHGWG